MKKITIIFLLLTNYSFGQELVQTLTSGITLLTGKANSAKSYVSSLGYELTERSGSEGQLFTYHKQSWNGVYSFTIATRGETVTAISWDDLKANIPYITSELRRLNFETIRDTRVMRSYGQTIMGFDNIDRNLLAILIIDDAGSTLSINLSAKFPAKPIKKAQEDKESPIGNTTNVVVNKPSEAQKRYEELISSYISGNKTLNSEDLDLTKVIPNSWEIKGQTQLEVISSGSKIYYEPDSLMPLLKKHFGNELIYLNVSKEGELTSIQNKGGTVSLSATTYPNLKRWITNVGSYQLRHKGSLYRINFQLLGLQLFSRTCTKSDIYYFKISGNEISYLKDSTQLKALTAFKIKDNNDICPRKGFFNFDTNDLEKKILSFARVDDIKDLKKLMNKSLGTGSNFLLKAGLTLATGVPVLLNDTDKNENLLRFDANYKREISYLIAKGETKALKIFEAPPIETNYQLNIFSGEKKDFVTVDLK